MSTFENLRRERTQIRRVFSMGYNEFMRLTNEETPNINDISAAFMKLSDKAERLFSLDNQVKDLLFVHVDDDSIIDKEFEEIETYRDKWLSAVTIKDRMITDKNKPPSSSTSEAGFVSKKNYRLPKPELKKYDGSLRDWISFWASFKKVHESEELDNEEKFQYLFQATVEKSPARELVESFPPSSNNYPKVIEQLKNRFGREGLLIQLYVRDLLGLVLNQATNKGSMTLTSRYDKLVCQIRSLDTLGVTTDKCSCMLIPLVESALPETTLRLWERYRVTNQIDIEKGLDDLLKFLRGEVESEERITLTKSVFMDTEPQKSHLIETRKPNVKVNRTPTSADLLNVNKSFNENCIFCEKGHESLNCFKAQDLDLDTMRNILRNKGCCFVCLKRGHLKKNCKAAVRCFICKGKHVTLLCSKRGAPNPSSSHISSPKTEHCLTNTFSNEVYLKTLKVMLRNDVEEYPCRLFFDDGSQRSYISKKMASRLGYEPIGSQTIVHGLFGGCRTNPEDHKIYQVRVSSIINDYACNFKALDKDVICQKLPVIDNSGPWVKELKELKISLTDRECGEIDILVGADISGKLLTGNRKILQCGLVAVETYLGWTLMGKTKEGNSCTSDNISITSLDVSASDLWRLDLIGIEDPVTVKTREEKTHDAILYFEETVRIKEDGRYEVRLPWLKDHPPLPNNFQIARKRLDSVLKKLNYSKLTYDYANIFAEWLSSGIIEETSINDQTSHFLPHRPVLKEESTTQIRPVFDASAKEIGHPSLNHCLEKGPNLIELIPRLLLRFRMNLLAVISDVKKAFLQIGIHPDDRPFLKFLWKDYHNNLKAFQHARVVFGITCSPFLLGAVFEHLLNRTEELCRQGIINYSEATITRLKKCFYVDNCVTSIAHEEELKLFIEESIAIFSMAKFELRGWEWNDPSLSESTNTPVLGIIWDRKNDTLKVRIPDLQFIKSFTRRTILSVIQKIFDPIGITSPSTIIPKRLIQKTWSTGGGWDDEPDSVCGNLFFTVVSLVEAKVRVAPVSSCTIPRLELLAALIGARLAHNIRTELGEIPCFYWSDSSTVLAWIKRKEPWSVFVWNRVKEIRRLSEEEEWHHVPGKSNPADLLSRGCSPRELALSRWWEGPSWLKLPDDKWPQGIDTPDEVEVSGECKNVAVLKTTCAISDNLWTEELCKRYSTYSQIVKVVAWMLRFANNCRRLSEQNNLLTAKELGEAETRLLRLVQIESFSGEGMKRLSKLKAFEDSFGLKRLTTRLWARNDAEDFRAPVVLPGNHHLIEKLIFEEYNHNCHLRGLGLLNHLRERYWVLRGRQTIRRVLKRCVVCQRFDSQNFEEDSPPLPENRVRDARVFEVTGTDYAGPLHLRNGEKVWICIFTCAVYRAIHLELVSSLSTEQFMMCIRRFIARRGRPSLIYSDNGNNFRGMDTLLKKIDWKQITAWSSVRQIEWRFNPPGAPWWGGFWERLIGLVKVLLRKVLGKACLTAEELYTVVCECESAVNSRPITYVSDIAMDPIPISPRMFLQDIEESGVPDMDQIESTKFSRRLRYRNRLKEELRKRFRAEYLGCLLQSSKKNKKTREPIVGEVVLIGYDNVKRIDWPLGVVERLIPGKDGKCRLVTVRTANGRMNRPIQRLFPLEVLGDELRTISEDEGFTEKRVPEVGEGDGSTEVRVPDISENDGSSEKQVQDDLKKEGGPLLRTRCGRGVRMPLRFL